MFAGLTLAEDGTVHSIEDVAKYENGNGNNEAALPQEYFMQQESSNVKKESINSIVQQQQQQQQEDKEQDYVDPSEFVSFKFVSGSIESTPHLRLSWTGF